MPAVPASPLRRCISPTASSCFRYSGDRLSDLPGDVAQDLTVLINPVVETIGRERAFGWEGCLSVPGLRGVVPRHLHVRYRGTGLDGEVIEREVEGFHARVVQHECDHLDGDSLSAAHDRSSAAGVCRGIAAPSDRPRRLSRREATA